MSSRSAEPVRAGSFRPELHGLRGLAIALVVVYHVWFDRVSGGVDVFLFLSAFFLTGTFVRRMEAGLPLAPIAYWGRVFKRLLPPAVVIILATLAGVRLLLPPSTWMPTINDAIASVLQVQNWLLIHRDADYEAAMSVGTSPLQHFWSLSIQGQVFLLWPLLFALCALLARLLRRSPRGVTAVALGLVLAVSLAWSVRSTGIQQPVAYFDTTARIWEFAAGSLLALLPSPGAASSRSGRGIRAAPAARGIRTARAARGAHGTRGARTARTARTARDARDALGASRRRAVRVGASWAGLAVLIGTGALLDGQSLFPGWVAAIPLLGATLVVLSGATGSRFGADRLLSSRPLAFLGDISYGLYLVHWPILTLTLLVTGRESAGALRGAVIIAASLVGAHLLTRLVDTPFRDWRWANATPWRSAAVAVTVLAVGLGPALAAQEHLEHAQDEAQRRAHADNPGGRVLDPDYTPHPSADPEAVPLPSAATLRQDWADLPEACEGEFAPEHPVVAEGCRSTEAPKDAKVMVAVGNSRLAQTAMSLVDPADEHHWRLIVLRRTSCQFTPGEATYAGPECDEHNTAALEYLRELQPDAVVLATTVYRGEAPEHESKVLDETVPQLLDEGVPVIAARTQPRTPEDPVTCGEDGGTEDECTQELDPQLMGPARADAGRLAELSPRGQLHELDLLPVTCPDGRCPPTIGNIHVMFDEDHVTATYMRSLGDEASRQLEESGFTW